MRSIPLAAIALAACTNQPASSDNVAAPTGNGQGVTAAAGPASRPAPGEQLTGSTSALTANSSGLNVRTSDTRIIVDLPADTLFAFDRADLTPEAATNLAKVADLIRQAPAGTIQVVGHSDGKGDDSYNLGLSEQRAQAVVNWMREQVGVRQRQFEVVGRGEAEPVAANSRPDGSDDPDGRARNRRVVVSIPR